MSFIEFVRNTRTEFEDFLQQKMPTQEDGEPIWKSLQGGKRLRPLLCILSYRARGGTAQDYEEALDVATAVELGHCASLCHNDIIDKDLERRGNPALWVENGIPRAMMVGHEAISWGFQISLDHGDDIAETFLGAWDQSLRGELREISARENQKGSTSTRLDIITKKTGGLFSAASKVGSQAADASQDLQKLMEEYGLMIGMAYQFADDLFELRNGKNEDLLKMLEDSGELKNATLEEYLEEEMRDVIKKSEKLSHNPRIPKSEFKEFLSEAPEFFVNQMLRESKY
ncbi:hypothetical protein AKJ42_03820 [candidate division MSBL1 archaeon SCGC-AAA261C02]|uniref:Polyprenyl synthetase n=1 Tax=candidate division MSBL1 archaeon SCGC-AAA261C02 TaxID=1698272 RepID=A0A133UY08_9EURY|nr:hypothetical protein AKJ42_03820 [candidate division MSBL1 archaeon SCGC-AAA261C02]